MNLAKQLTNQAIALLEVAVEHALLKKGEAHGTKEYFPAADIGRAIGTLGNRESPSRIHTTILYKLKDEGRVEVAWSERGKRRIVGWRLTDTERRRLNLSQ